MSGETTPELLAQSQVHPTLVVRDLEELGELLNPSPLSAPGPRRERSLMMKKRIAGLLLAAGLCLMLTGCQGEAISLPPAGKVEAIQGENLAGEPVALTEAEDIAAVMEVLSTGRSTGRESVQDAPLTETYGSLTLENQRGHKEQWGRETVPSSYATCTASRKPVRPVQTSS